MISQRYHRQALLPELGPRGQAKLLESKILLVGVGGLGCPAAQYLAAAGVGTLGLLDDDVVDSSNLHRQILFSDADAQHKIPKVEAAQRALAALNPDIEIRIHAMRLDAENAEPLFKDYDFIVDGSDNFQTKFLVNDVASKFGKPVVQGAVSRFEGRVAIYGLPGYACFRCLYPEAPSMPIANCAQEGVLGPVAGAVGCVQALEAIKLAAQCESLPPLKGKVWIIDGLSLQSSLYPAPRRKDCPTCASKAQSAPQKAPKKADPNELPSDLISAEELQRDLNAYSLLDVREQQEWDRGHLPGALFFPLSKIQQGEVPELPKDAKPCILYCHAGVRSAVALEMLREHLPAARHLQGGLLAWSGPLSFG